MRRGGTLQFTGGVREFFSLAPFHNMQLENFRAALDAPGEWFLARDGTLSYLPAPRRDSSDKAEAWAPVAAQWLIVKGDPAKEQFVEKLAFPRADASADRATRCRRKACITARPSPG